MAEEKYVPALGFHLFTDYYQNVVDIFVKDNYVKQVLVDHLKTSNNKILDIACGPGKLIKLIHENYPCCEVVGNDIDPQMVEIAKKETGLEITQYDCQKTGFPDQEFDVVVESLMFHHLKDQQKENALDEIHRILKDGGKFYFCDWYNQKGFSKVKFQLVRLLDGYNVTLQHSDKTIKSTIEKKGFKCSKIIAEIETTCGNLAIILFEKI